MPGTITRDAAKGLITITGGTVAAPVTCGDIIAAAVAGGWSTVISSGSTLVLLDHIAFGTTAAPCHFADTRKTIQIGVQGASRGLATVGTFRLGELAGGVGVDGCKMVMYLNNGGAGAVSAFSGVATPGVMIGTKLYGSSLDLYYTGNGFTEFVTDGATEWIDSAASANGTIAFAGGTIGLIRRFAPNYSRGTYALYQYSQNLLMESVVLDQVQGILSGGVGATFNGIDFGAKEMRRYYAALVTLNDCVIPDTQINNTDAHVNAWVKKLFTHSTQALYNGLPLAGAKVRMSVSGGVQDYVGTTNAGGLVSGGLILAKQHNWAMTTNAYTLNDRSSKILRLRKYGLKFVEQTITLNAKTAAQVPMQDEAVTLAAQGTTSALPAVTTLKQLYEVSRYYGEVDLSLPDPVSLAGGVLDFGGYNVVLSTAAPAVWAVAGNTVTVKCAASVASAPDAASIKTTGTVTLAGVTAGFGIVDAAGDSYLKFSGIDAWIVYSDSGRTTQIGAGTGSQLFRFVFASGVTYYLKCVAGSTEFAMIATPTTAGETAVSLSTQALLTTLQAQVSAVKLDTVLIKAAI